MSVSYDILDLADFPIIVTNSSFFIKHKNTVASRLFPKIRKGSKIMRHAVDTNGCTNSGDLCEIDFQTGTQFKRALTFCPSADDVFFFFFSYAQFCECEKLTERVKEVYSGNFLDFYIAAYNQYGKSQSADVLSRKSHSHAPERLYEELMLLVHACADRPAFMKKDIYDMAELVLKISRRVGSSLRALGLKMPAAKISPKAEKFCFCKINLNNFSFAVFRMIYAGYSFSCDGGVNMSLEISGSGDALLCVYTKIDRAESGRKNNSFSSLLADFSELSLETEILKKLDLLEKSLTYSLEDSVLKIEFKIKCIDGLEPLMLRSDPFGKRAKKISSSIGANILKLKKLLSK